MELTKDAYLLPEIVHTPLGQLLGHFDRNVMYGPWCWLRILKVCSLAGFTHVVRVGAKRKTLVIG